MNIGVTVGDETVCVLLYANDIVLLADSVDNLQSLLDEVHLWCQSNDLCINESKTKLYIFVWGLQLLEHVIYLNAGIRY